MNLDLASVLVMTALVVNVSGILFIVETLLRRDEGAGRIWALAFLAAMLTTLAYIVWAQTPEAWWAVAVGNAAFVAGTGCMWLGCRRFNGRRMGWPSALVAVAVLAAAVAVVIEGPDGGDWAGALWMFVPLVGIRRRRRGRVPARRPRRVAHGMGAQRRCSRFQSLYYLSRTTAFLTSGAESSLFLSAFGTMPTSFLTVTLTIVAVVVTSVLRATRAPMRGYLRPAGFGTARDGILSKDVFDGALDRSVRTRALALGARRCDRGADRRPGADLDRVRQRGRARRDRDLAQRASAGTRRPNAFVAEDGPSGLLVGVLVDSPREARRQAGVDLPRSLRRSGHAVGGTGVIPVVGVGVGLSDTTGYDAEALASVAREAASRAATTSRRRCSSGDDE